MSNGQERPPVIKSEDWWSCFLGWFIILVAIIGLREVEAGKWAVGLLPSGPKIATWTGLGAAFPKGIATLWSTIGHFVFLLVLTGIGGAFMKYDFKRYIPGFIIIYFLAFLGIVLSKQAFFHKWGIEYVIFALAFGLIISNIFKVPQFMKAAGQTEYFIKIGLVCMGAGIVFSDVVRGGFMGLVQALLVATAVWFITYWIC
ncbi:MAG: putative sulfate exporter family transporter, partial [Desulfobacterales bacterium]